MNELDNLWAELALAVTNTAGVPGATLTSLALLYFTLHCLRANGNPVGRHLLIMVPLIMLVLGGGAWVNEHLIKHLAAVPRPHISYLAESADHPPLLGMSVSQFYALPGKSARREQLRSALNSPAGMQLELSPAVRRHWADQDGFGFPSGHTFAAGFIASFFLLAGLAWCSPRRVLAGLVLVSWVLALGYSRLVLGVHSLLDVVAGGLLGAGLGLLSYLLLYFMLRNHRPGKSA